MKIQFSKEWRRTAIDKLKSVRVNKQSSLVWDNYHHGLREELIDKEEILAMFNFIVRHRKDRTLVTKSFLKAGQRAGKNLFWKWMGECRVDTTPKTEAVISKYNFWDMTIISRNGKKLTSETLDMLVRLSRAGSLPTKRNISDLDLEEILTAVEKGYEYNELGWIFSSKVTEEKEERKLEQVKTWLRKIVLQRQIKQGHDAKKRVVVNPRL